VNFWGSAAPFRVHRAWKTPETVSWQEIGQRAPGPDEIQAWIWPWWGRVKDSGGVPDRFANLEQDFGDALQQVFDGATAGQVELDAILVLHELHGDLEEFEDHCSRLGFGEFGVH
jgi:hypothetical protein